MALARRVTAPARTVAPPPPPPTTGGGVNFGGEGFFTGGGLGLPEGNYACTFRTQMFQPTKKDGTASRTPAFLAVMLTAYPINKDGQLLGEPSEHPLGCGSSAHESFVPSADGLGFDPVPNGKSSGMWEYSNFGLFMESLKNAGLPPGLLANSLEPLDGLWVHTQNIPEPEEKKAAGRKARAKTGGAAMMGQQQEEDTNRQVTVVTEILEGGKPWEGGGGIPDGAEAPAAKPAPAPRGRAAAAPAPAAPAADASDEEAIGNATLEALSAVLGEEKNAAGMMKVALKTAAYQAAKAKFGEEMAQVVMDTYINADDTLNSALGELGYKIQGLKVVPAA